jgi:hypothetical protein
MGGLTGIMWKDKREFTCWPTSTNLQWGKICDKQNALKRTIVKCGMSIKATEWPTGIRQVEQELQLEALKKFKS